MSILVAALALADPAATIKVTPGKVIPNIKPIALAAAPTGSKFIVTGEDGTVRVMDSKLKQTVKQLPNHPQAAYGVAWSPDGKFIATGDETARIWITDTAHWSKVREYRTHTKGIQRLSFNKSSDILVSTGKDDQVNVYNLKTKSPKQERIILGKGCNLYGGTFLPTSSNLFFVGTLDAHGSRCYDCKTGDTKLFLSEKEGQGVLNLAVNKAGTRVVSAEKDGTLVLWDTKNGKNLGKLKGHADWVMDAAFSPNGRLIASSSSDGTIRVWDTKTMSSIAKLKGPSGVGTALCFSADGATLIAADDFGSLQFNTVSPAQDAVAPVVKKKRRH